MTESEKIYDSLLKKDKETEQEHTEIEEQQQEQTMDEELKIEEYKQKIEELDKKLAELKATKIRELKIKAMKERNYSLEQISRYLDFIEGETEQEIKDSVWKLSEKIPPKTSYVDPSPMNSERDQPKYADKPEEIDRQLFERIKHKIRRGGVRP